MTDAPSTDAVSPTDATGDADAGAVDGRRLRAERNREAVVTAILELLRDGVERPGAAEIAERSGVSVRSVFRHFDDLESLYAAAVQHQQARLATLLVAPPAVGSLGARVAALAAARAALFEEMTPTRVAAERLRRTSPVIDENLGRVRRLLRHQVAVQLADELAALDEPAREDCLDAVDLVLSWRAWDQLRSEQECSIDRARHLVAEATLACLAHAGAA